MTWKILCLSLTNGEVAPLAKSKRNISKKEQKRLTKKFKNDEDYAGTIVYPDNRLGLSENELKTLTTI